MMPELGKYALWVLSAYGVSLLLLGGIVLLSILQARRTLRDLRAMEAGRQSARAAEAPQGEGAHG
jgi:heme exporter protein D